MNATIKTYNDYIEQRLNGGDALYRPLVLGASALEQTAEEFAIIQIEEDVFSVYNFRVQKGRMQISTFSENNPHQLKTLFAPIKLTEEVARWWDSVFFKSSGAVLYDTYYDSLSIANQSDITFHDLIEDVKTEMAGWNISTSSEKVFVVGAYAQYAIVLYALQTLTGSTVLTLDEATTVPDESDIVIQDNPTLDQEQIAIRGGLALRTFINTPLRIIYPIDDEVDTRAAFMQTLWGDIVPKEGQEDYRVSQHRFKYIDIKVDCDVCGNVFLTCSDLHGHKKVVAVK